MSYSADERRDKAVENIKEAIGHLGKIVIDEVWGTEDYNKEYMLKLRDTLYQLMSIRDDIEV